MEIFTVSFFGHREIDRFDFAEEQIYKIVSELIQKKEYVDFLVGRNGEFDQLVSSCIIRVKKEIFSSNSSLNLILPYPTAEYLHNENSFKNYYDLIEIFGNRNTYFKAAFQKRNQEMIARSDLCVFYVAHNSGGAFQSLQYAMKHNKCIINIAAPIVDDPPV